MLRKRSSKSEERKLGKRSGAALAFHALSSRPQSGRAPECEALYLLPPGFHAHPILSACATLYLSLSLWSYLCHVLSLCTCLCFALSLGIHKHQFISVFSSCGLYAFTLSTLANCHVSTLATQINRLTLLHEAPSTDVLLKHIKLTRSFRVPCKIEKKGVVGAVGDVQAEKDTGRGS